MLTHPLRGKTPVLGFAAASGTGKTTLLREVIPRLRRAGVRPGLIKHTHHDFEMDEPGKDSFELRKAGASPVLIASHRRRGIFFEHEHPREPVLAEELACLESLSLDLILVEGFRHECFPKIELSRGALDAPYLFVSDPSIIALATDGVPPADIQIPVLDLNDPDAVSQFILEIFMPEARHVVSL